MICFDFFKKKLKAYFDQEVSEWIDENIDQISIDKASKLTFSCRIVLLTYYFPFMNELLDSAWNTHRPNLLEGEAERQHEVEALLKRFETFEFKLAEDPETGANACFAYAVEKTIEGASPGKKYIIITIQGTSESTDWAQNFKLSQKSFEETDAYVHKGFYEQFQALKPEMVSFIDQKKEEKDQIDEILFVGHSLGGAVAALAGASLAPLYDNIKSRVVTIGAPLVGAKSFQDLFKKRIKHHTRLRLLTDPVPLSPRFYWYRHTCDDGDVENGDFVIYDEDDLALFTHFAFQYIRGVERTKKDVLKKKFSHAVERASSLLDVQDSTIEEKKKKVEIKKLSEKEIRVYEKVFKSYDNAPQDGTVTTKEFATVLRKSKPDYSSARIEQIISDLDKNKDGIISFAEFLELMAAETEINKENGGHVLRAVFKQFDEDKNGTISALEIQKLLKKLGDNLSDKEVNEIIRGVDSDGDGKIDYEEFVNMLL